MTIKTLSLFGVWGGPGEGYVEPIFALFCPFLPPPQNTPFFAFFYPFFGPILPLFLDTPLKYPFFTICKCQFSCASHEDAAYLEIGDLLADCYAFAPRIGMYLGRVNH